MFKFFILLTFLSLLYSCSGGAEDAITATPIGQSPPTSSSTAALVITGALPPDAATVSTIHTYLEDKWN